MILKHDRLLDFLKLVQRKKRKQRQLQKMRSLELDVAFAKREYTVVGKLGNVKRDRRNVIHKIHGLSDAFFKLYFRLCRADFYNLLNDIKGALHEPNVSQAERSSGTPICLELRLAVALRFLAGGSYLDISFAFDIDYKSVMKYVWEVLNAIDSVVDNIKFPFRDETKLRSLEQGFMRYCKGAFPGTVAAGDGVVFKIRKPPAKYVDGNVQSYFNRKGFSFWRFSLDFYLHYQNQCQTDHACCRWCSFPRASRHSRTRSLSASRLL